MFRIVRGKTLAAVAGVGVIALVLGACGSSGSAGTDGAPPAANTPPASTPAAVDTSTGGGEAAAPSTDAAPSTGAPASGTDAAPSPDGQLPSSTDWCETVKRAYPDISGKSVSVYTSITAPEDALYKQAWQKFTDCTGTTINYDGSKEFEAQIGVRVSSGNPPDIAIFPQPGLLQKTVEDSGAVIPVADDAKAMVEKYWSKEWMDYGTVNGKFFGIPNSANFKSLIWYSPKTFADKGWTVPTRWDDVIKLSDEVVADGGQPWCAGIGSGDATGWPATDWLEDFVLRSAGPDVYDQWVSHDVKFADKPIAEALAKVGEVLKNPKYVNGGYGDVASIASTTFQDGGLPVLHGKCTFYRMASFYETNWPKGTDVSENGDAWAFYLPAFNDDFGNPVLSGGEFFAGFRDAPEVHAFQYFLTTPDYVNDRAKLGNFLSANKGLLADSLQTPIQKLSLQYLQDPDSVVRFDASDMMPAEVGSGAEWKQLTSWITGQDDATTLANIDAVWPAG